MNKIVGIAAVAAVAVGAYIFLQPGAEPESKELLIYNWSDYIAEDTIKNFEAETGIKVTYDVFDSNEVLEAKLLSGGTGYDLVVPSGAFLELQIQAGVFQELDRSKISNYGALDKTIMDVVAAHDPGNKFAIPYLWGTTGLGYNVAEVEARIGSDAPTDSWDLLFKPENASKLAECGIAVLDAPTEVMEIALNYLGHHPIRPTDAQLKEATDLVKGVRPYIKYFHSSQYIDDLANGEICLTLGWSGDVFQAVDSAGEQDRELSYYIPKEGTVQWFDLLAIPSDAKNVDNAHKFVDYLLRKEVMAGISNYVWYANAVPASMELIEAEIKEDPAIFPPADVLSKLWADEAATPEIRRAVNRAFTEIKTGT